ncbi:hypothetical protein [Endozoicomonas elysicola]|uniref:Uncharacterized protein n=1 Tax=Endozoicomonas elysicola TaxID=305900 RepID=A0A081KAW7_9GAMM|nr:hypothetical protein [Endozoicomonas elysicola]KEI71293.1 hypothetical protein GV64_11580 [Endozoicomonas elysicola]
MEFDGRLQGAGQSSFATRDSGSAIKGQEPDQKVNVFHREAQGSPVNEPRVATHQEGSSAHSSTVPIHRDKPSLMQASVRTVDVTPYHVQSPGGNEEPVREVEDCIIGQELTTGGTAGMDTIRSDGSANAVFVEEEVTEDSVAEASQSELSTRGDGVPRSHQSTSEIKGEYEPETVSGAKVASSDSSRDQFKDLVNQGRYFVSCLSSYHRCPHYLPMPQLINCLINLPGKDLITFFENTGLLARVALDWFDDHSNEAILKAMTPTLVEGELNLDQLKRLLFKPLNARQGSYFSQYLYVIRYAHVCGVRANTAIALMGLLKAAVVDKVAAQRILRWITDVEVQKAGSGGFSSKKDSDIAKQLSASFRHFKKQAAKLDAAARRKGESAGRRKEEATRYKDTAAHYKDEVSALLEQYQTVLKVLSENVGNNESIKKLKERAQTASSSWAERIGEKTGSISICESPETALVDLQPEQAGDSLSERMALAIKEMQDQGEQINKSRFRNWISGEPEKEAPTADQKVDQLQQQVGQQAEEITVLRRQVTELLKRVSAPPESSEGGQEAQS